MAKTNHDAREFVEATLRDSHRPNLDPPVPDPAQHDRCLPSQVITDNADGTLTILGDCVCSGEPYSVRVPVEGWLAWKAGVPIKEAMPHLSAQSREALVSGISPMGYELPCEPYEDDADVDELAALFLFRPTSSVPPREWTAVPRSEDLALLRAAHGGCLNNVRAALELGADVNARDRSVFNFSVLEWAAISEHEHLIADLLEAGADINDDYRGRTALDSARSFAADAVIRTLIAEGAIGGADTP